jgi:hypothetical protein
MHGIIVVHVVRAYMHLATVVVDCMTCQRPCLMMIRQHVDVNFVHGPTRHPRIVVKVTLSRASDMPVEDSLQEGTDFFKIIVF